MAGGANWQSISIRGATAMSLAESRGHDMVVRLIQDLGDVNADIPQGWSLQHHKKASLNIHPSINLYGFICVLF